MQNLDKVIVCFALFILTGCSGTLPTQSDDKNVLAKETTVSLPVSTTSADEKQLETVAKPTPQGHPKTYDDLWLLISDKLTLERYADKKVVKQKIDWFVRNQDYLDRVADRARLYLYHIVDQIEQRNMPIELALLPIVESAYKPFAYSRSHASGIWQFIPNTGKRFGLKQNWWYDGRRDIVAATDAALDYLETLHQHFDGNWYHALAAYNSGEGNVAKAIKRNKQKGKKTDFWSLRLPRETRNYVPKLLAIAEVLKHSEKYKLNFKAIENRPYFQSIDISNQVDLATVADLSDLTIDEIYMLNPGFNRWAADPNGPYRILLPVNKAELFKQRLAKIPTSEHINWERHKIKKSESLSIIAKRYLTSITALKKINRLKTSRIRAGDSLLIPVAKEPEKYYSLSADSRKLRHLKVTGDGKRYIYLVKPGDSLWNIGQSYGVSIAQLTRWNGISRKSILQPGQKIVVWVKEKKAKSKNDRIVQ